MRSASGRRLALKQRSFGQARGGSRGGLSRLIEPFERKSEFVRFLNERSGGDGTVVAASRLVDSPL
jgi:hypothetical protein